MVPKESAVTLHAGKRKLTLKAADLEHYLGERGRRGNKLPRGLQRVDAIEIDNVEHLGIDQQDDSSEFQLD